MRQSGELLTAYQEAVKHDPLVIAEKAIVGGEYTVAIIGEGDSMQALPIIKIEPATEFYDYEAKYFRDDTSYCSPCGFSQARDIELSARAIDAVRVLGCPGDGRVAILIA